MDWTNLVTSDLEEPHFYGPVGYREDQGRKGVYSGDHSLVANRGTFTQNLCSACTNNVKRH
jgi:hypothetical protein